MKIVLVLLVSASLACAAEVDDYFRRYIHAVSGDELDANCERELRQAIAIAGDASMTVRLPEHYSRVIAIWGERARPESAKPMGEVIAALRAQGEAVADSQPELAQDCARLWSDLSSVCLSIGYDDGAKLAWRDFADAMRGRGTPFASGALLEAAPRCVASAKREEVLALLDDSDVREDVGEAAAELWRAVAPTAAESRQVAESGSDIAVASLLYSLAPVDAAILTLLAERGGRASDHRLFLQALYGTCERLRTRVAAKPEEELAPYLDRLVAVESTDAGEAYFSGITAPGQLLRVVADTVDEIIRTGVPKQDLVGHVDWIAAGIAEVRDPRLADWLITFVKELRGQSEAPDQ